MGDAQELAGYYNLGINERLNATLAKRDKDHDGKLNVTEYIGTLRTNSTKGREAEEEFKRLDADHDGFLNHGELLQLESGQSDLIEFFSNADKNGDLLLSVDELQKAKQILPQSDVKDYFLEWKLTTVQKKYTKSCEGVVNIAHAPSRSVHWTF